MGKRDNRRSKKMRRKVAQTKLKARKARHATVKRTERAAAKGGAPAAKKEKK
jgi:hypothetical protein